MSYYKDPDPVVRPGDIVRLSPFFQSLRPPIVHVSSSKSVTDGRHRTDLLGGVGGAVVPTKILSGERKTEFVVPGKLDFALLLTRGCDIENGSHRQLAAIRPLATVQGEEKQADVIEGKTTSLLYLPAAAPDGRQLFGDSFIDFRYIVTLDKGLFDTLERPISLSPDEGLLDVYFGWMRHTIGKKVPVTTTCPSCSTPIPVFEAVREIANPPADY
jgi:hypothetical protein